MNQSETFLTFNNGVLAVPNYTKEFSDIPWTQHPAFEGVELKHIVTAQDTDGQFSYHLVRIAAITFCSKKCPCGFIRQGHFHIHS